MKKITVAYWLSPIDGIKYKHREEFEYTTRKMNAIIKDVLAHNCSVMIRPQDNGILIWIDKGRFGQS